MRMNTARKTSAALLAALAGTALTASAANGLVYGNVSGWTVLTDPERSYRCFAEVQYEGGTLVRIGFNSADGGLYVSFVDPALRGLAAGSEYVTMLGFDDQDTMRANGTALAQADRDSGGIHLAIPAANREPFIADFMARHTLTVTVDGREPLELSLAGSLRATAMLRDCQGSVARHVNAAR